MPIIDNALQFGQAQRTEDATRILKEEPAKNGKTP